MAKHKMKKHTKIILVTVVTLGVAGGFLTHKYRGGPDAHAERFVSHIERELDLSLEQTQSLRDLKNVLMQIRQDMRGSREAQFNEIVELMGDPVLDQDKALAMVERKTRAVDERAPDIVAALANFTDHLSNSQRREIREKLENKIGCWRRWH